MRKVTLYNVDLSIDFSFLKTKAKDFEELSDRRITCTIDKLYELVLFCDYLDFEEEQKDERLVKNCDFLVGSNKDFTIEHQGLKLSSFYSGSFLAIPTILDMKLIWDEREPIILTKRVINIKIRCEFEDKHLTYRFPSSKYMIKEGNIETSDMNDQPCYVNEEDEIYYHSCLLPWNFCHGCFSKNAMRLKLCKECYRESNEPEILKDRIDCLEFYVQDIYEHFKEKS